MTEARLRKAAGRIEEAPEMTTLMDRAASEKLIAVTYTTVDSPFGTFVCAVTDTGIVRLALAPNRTEEIVQELADRLSPRVLENSSKLDPVRRQLDEYFAGSRVAFDLTIDWSLVSGDFSKKALHALMRVPYGSVTSYRDIAVSAGSPRAARAAGNALHNNPIPIVVPCHRVLHSGGGLGGYGGGLPMKEALLRLEGAL